MDRPGNLPGGQISEIMNIHSRRHYIVSTAPEIGQDYWTTGVISILERESALGLLKREPNIENPIVVFIRNNKQDAYQVHAEVRHIVLSLPEDDWFTSFPSPRPPEGYSEGARRKLKIHFSEEPPHQPAIKPETCSLSGKQADDVIDAFCDMLAEGAPIVGDASKLPFPKDIIEQAFAMKIDEYEQLRAIVPEAFEQTDCNIDLEQLRAMQVRISDWYDIDSSDKAAIERLNKTEGPTPVWALPLIVKYLSRGAGG